MLSSLDDVGRSCTKVHRLSKTKSCSRTCWKTLFVCPLYPGQTERGTEGKTSIAEPTHAGVESKTLLELGLSPSSGDAEEKYSHSLGAVPALGLAVGSLQEDAETLSCSQASIFGPISLFPLKAANGRLIYPLTKCQSLIMSSVSWSHSPGSLFIDEVLVSLEQKLPHSE